MMNISNKNKQFLMFIEKKTSKRPIATWGEWRTGVHFAHILRSAFTSEDPKSTKNTVKPSVFFYALWVHKSFLWNVGEIDHCRWWWRGAIFGSCESLWWPVEIVEMPKMSVCIVNQCIYLLLIELRTAKSLLAT